MDFNRSVVVSILPFKLSAAPFHSRSLGEIVDLPVLNGVPVIDANRHVCRMAKQNKPTTVHEV